MQGATEGGEASFGDSGKNISGSTVDGGTEIERGIHKSFFSVEDVRDSWVGATGAEDDRRTERVLQVSARS